jgi:hypothetical protein
VAAAYEVDADHPGLCRVHGAGVGTRVPHPVPGGVVKAQIRCSDCGILVTYSGDEEVADLAGLRAERHHLKNTGRPGYNIPPFHATTVEILSEWKTLAEPVDLTS